jgi:hypothetical protein
MRGEEKLKEKSEICCQTDIKGTEVVMLLQGDVYGP